MKLKVLATLVLLQMGAILIAPGDVALEDNAVANNVVVVPGRPGFGDEGFNFDTSLFEAADQLDAETHTGNTLEHPTFVSDDSYVSSALPDLVTPDFDIDKFLAEFDRIDCSKYNGDKADPLNVLCDDLLMNSAFGPLGNFNSDHYQFYNYLKDSIFQPLAYDISKRENLADMIGDVTSLAQKNSLFYGQPLTSNYNKFQEAVLKIFEDIAGKTSDMEANRDVINELMISVLKRFHLYWNYLRYQNNFDKLKVDTKEIMKTILRTYMMKRDFLNYVSKTLIRGIIQAYYRFIRAHKMVDILNRYGPYLISAQIINRYKNFADRIQSSNFNHVMAVKEISYLISLLQVYHILSYKQGIPDSTIQINYKTEILLRIQREYDNYVKLLPQASQLQRVKTIKEYTAVLLLKFKHITFIMFQYHGIAQYANLPQMNYIKSTFAVKIYYEMLDNMLMLPKSCVNFLLLKSCVIHETTKNLRYITTKYNIKRSTYGWYFLQELSSMMKSLYSKANSQTWEQWNNFKTYYYSNLFSVMYTYKKLFQVADMDVVEDLETQLGTIIDTAKKSTNASPGTFRLMDALDKDLYNEFLSIKADYNNYAPVEHDPSILQFLKTRLISFIGNFNKEHRESLNDDIDQVTKEIKSALERWIQQVPNKLDTVVAVSTLNTSPEFQQINFVPSSPKDKLGVPSNVFSIFSPTPPQPVEATLTTPTNPPPATPVQTVGQPLQPATPVEENLPLQPPRIEPLEAQAPDQNRGVPNPDNVGTLEPLPESATSSRSLRLSDDLIQLKRQMREVKSSLKRKI